MSRKWRIVGTNKRFYFVVWQQNDKRSTSYSQWRVTRQPSGQTLARVFYSRESAIEHARELQQDN